MATAVKRTFALYLMHVWLSELDQRVAQGEAVLLAEAIRE
jgi:hypothetical protein